MEARFLSLKKWSWNVLRKATIVTNATTVWFVGYGSGCWLFCRSSCPISTRVCLCWQAMKRMYRGGAEGFLNDSADIPSGDVSFEGRNICSPQIRRLSMDNGSFPCSRKVAQFSCSSNGQTTAKLRLKTVTGSRGFPFFFLFFFRSTATLCLLIVRFRSTPCNMVAASSTSSPSLLRYRYLTFFPKSRPPFMFSSGPALEAVSQSRSLGSLQTKGARSLIIDVSMWSSQPRRLWLCTPSSSSTSLPAARSFERQLRFGIQLSVYWKVTPFHLFLPPPPTPIQTFPPHASMFSLAANKFPSQYCALLSLASRTRRWILSLPFTVLRYLIMFYFFLFFISHVSEVREYFYLFFFSPYFCCATVLYHSLVPLHRVMSFSLTHAATLMSNLKRCCVFCLLAFPIFSHVCTFDAAAVLVPMVWRRYFCCSFFPSCI